MSISELIISSVNIILTLIDTKWFQPLLIAFLAALFTQRLNNSLTRKREKDNKRVETLKSFYYKIVPEIYDYFTIETDFRKGHDLKSHVKARDLKKRILNLISENTLYVNYEIHEKYRKVMKNKYFDDLSGFQVEVAEIELFHTIVEEYIRVLKDIENIDTKLDYQYACLLIIWKNTIAYCGDYGLAYPAISKNFYFNSNELNKKTLEKLRKLEMERIHSNKHKVLFRQILKKLVSEKSINKKEKDDFINEFFVQTHEVNNSHAIAVLSNIDINFGNLTVDLRTEYRKVLLTELYNDKYYKFDESKYDFNYDNKSFSSLHSELINAINYLKEKGLVRLEIDEQRTRLIITADGEDLYEKRFFSDEYI